MSLYAPLICVDTNGGAGVDNVSLTAPAREAYVIVFATAMHNHGAGSPVLWSLIDAVGPTETYIQFTAAVAASTINALDLGVGQRLVLNPGEALKVKADDVAAGEFCYLRVAYYRLRNVRG